MLSVVKSAASKSNRVLVSSSTRKARYKKSPILRYFERKPSLSCSRRMFEFMAQDTGIIVVSADIVSLTI